MLNNVKEKLNFKEEIFIKIIQFLSIQDIAILKF